MFKSTRATIGICLLGEASVATVTGWATGFFAQVVSFFNGLWNSFIAWLNSPFGWDHLLAGAGVLIAPIILLVVILALADN
ncbi:hypothetical protein [Saccharopolyspora hattusasensis]|uniref:hypothetical protein n=1 Tax=Saccharopolyspora hattusasensis TaxID=1128679 RepID=UPI003D98900F